MISSDERKVYKNAAVLAIRTLVTIPIGFYSVRLAMSLLGVADYGLANVLGGLSAVAITLSYCISNMARRFLCFDLADENVERTRNLFSMLFWVYVISALIFIIALEVFGGWMVFCEIKFEPDKMWSGFWYYQMVVLTFIIQYLGGVYLTLLVSYEHMSFVAWVVIAESIFHILLLVVLKLCNNVELLVPYGIVNVITASLSGGLYFSYSYLKYKVITTIKWYWDTSLFKRLFSFAFWQLQAGIVGSIYGIVNGVLLNNYFSSAFNASQGVAGLINSKVTAFGLNFVSAAQPKLIKYYASSQINEMEFLLIRITKFSFFTLILIGFPLFINLDFILSVWLKEVPPYCAEFVLLGFATALANVTCAPGDTVIDATGKIMGMQLFRSIIPWIMLGVVYVTLSNGACPLVIPGTAFVAAIVANFVRFGFIKCLIPEFKMLLFWLSLLKSLAMVFVTCSLAIIIRIQLLTNVHWTTAIVTSSVVEAILLIVIFRFGLSAGERDEAILFIRRHRKRR